LASPFSTKAMKAGSSEQRSVALKPAITILEKHGYQINEEEAQGILNRLYFLGKLTVNQHIKTPLTSNIKAMITADLYVRVSTDEQADKGYYIRCQEEVLRKYCGIQNIAVRRVIHEDYFAKTFNRPAWSEMLKKLNKERANQLICYYSLSGIALAVMPETLIK
jgi:hypothetical protein